MVSPSPSVSRSASLFKRNGGHAAVKATVEHFYQRALADQAVEPFFKNTKMAWLKEQQIDFFSHALGGPSKYKGRSMKNAHAHLEIQEKHFNRVAMHLDDTLEALRVPPELRKETLGVV